MALLDTVLVTFFVAVGSSLLMVGAVCLIRWLHGKFYVRRQKARKLVYPSPSPCAVLHPLKQPLYDREYVGPGKVERRELFEVLIGDKNSQGDNKTLSDTNLQRPSQLGTPSEFDFWALRVEPDPDNDPEDWLRYYYNAVLTWNFDQEKPWLQVPLSYIPCAATITDEETLKTYASAILNPEDDRWKKLAIVGIDDRNNMTAGDRDRIKELFESGKPYKVEERRLIDVGGKPVRIRSKEGFSVTISEPTGIELKKRVGFRVYMEGIFYAAL